jgi:hypothetical protein
MSLTIEQSWRQLYHDMLHVSFQQKNQLVRGRLLPQVIHQGATGAKDYFDRLSNLVANRVINPMGQTKVLNIDHTRRATTLKSYDGALLVSDEHNMRSMINPTSDYREAIVSALVRAGDKLVLDAAIGAAETAVITTGTAAIASGGTVALPAGQKVGSGIAIVLANITAANTKLSKGGAPNGAGERLFFYSPGQIADIMAITQASSSDFTKNQIHDKGTINDLMWQGFTWVEIQDPVDPDTLTAKENMLQLVSTTRSCVAMYRGAVGMSVAQEIESKFDILPQQNHCIQVRSIMKMDAVRLWEGCVVQVDVLEN